MKHPRPSQEVHSSQFTQASGPDADVLVLGAGVIGVTTAYALARRGYSVIVVDRADGPAQGSSFANGAQLSYAYTDALAQTSLLGKIPGLVFGRDPAFRISLSADPDFVRWGLEFLRNCTDAAFTENTLSALELGLESRAAMAELCQRHPFDFAHTTPGKLHIFRSEASLEQARAVAQLKQSYGIDQKVLTAAQAMAIEPALLHTEPFTGALWTPGEEVGDPHLFCKELLGVLKRDYGVRQAFGFDLAGLEEQAGIVTARSAHGDVITARKAVVCLGAEAAGFLAGLGVHVPIQPMKGYSFTAPFGPFAPKVSITDTSRKIVFCRLGGVMRMAGLAELGKKDRRVDPARLQTLVDGAKASLPMAADYEAGVPNDMGGWAGLRPMTPNSRPIIRQERSCLFLNVGHGMLGWTFACGAAERLAALVEATGSKTSAIRKEN